MKTCEYKIIESYDREKLEKEVVEAMNDGWELAGGVNQIINQREDFYYYQAVYRVRIEL